MIDIVSNILLFNSKLNYVSLCQVSTSATTLSQKNRPYGGGKKVRIILTTLKGQVICATLSKASKSKSLD
jgi:hypothetical protein